MVHSDLTFITNEDGKSLKDRFAVLIKDARFFDVLVGYFYTSGFSAIYPSLEKTEKIRILIGISTNRQTYDLLQKAQSYREMKEQLGEALREEMELSENTFSIEEGIQKFLEWLKNGKMEIRAYPEEKIHSKLYIMTFHEGDRDMGRVITGSSNLTQNGLVDNLEFNVELKNPSDYLFAKEKFEELWRKGVDVQEQYIETIQKDTWLRDDISPYELYLKFLYEYFKAEINEDAKTLDHTDRPENFKELKYQSDAVINARKIVEEYGGVFLSDVVGLGKTFMGTMLCKELKGRTLVLAPPHLIDEHNQGSWENAFRSFGFRAREYRCRSIGKLDSILEREEHKGFDIVLIDESHRFRNEETESYIKLAQICRGKKVILVTATPYNNSPKDLLAQIKLFQKGKKSTIPNLPDLEGFFKSLEKKTKNLDRKNDKEEFMSITRENAKIIRERVLRYLMVRRTRKEIMAHYEEDLRDQKMKFPEVADPKPVFYEFNEEENNIFFRTLSLITESLTFARYTSLLYKEGNLKQIDELSQKNMRKFMKMLFVKRLESSFYAFTQTLGRFIESYKRFIEEFDKGKVYLSKKDTQKIFEYLENDDFEGVNRLLESGRAEEYESSEFGEDFRSILVQDMGILKEIEKMWNGMKRDPKILAFKNKLAKESVIRGNKLILFTESKETAKYLERELQDTFPNEILSFCGENSAQEREIVMANFDASAKIKKDEYRILITTDVLSEGANLHRSNVVINYDIPWNPTRVMQRVGRINRVDSTHEKIYTYTFFPTDESNNEIKLRECAEAKIEAFIALLGADAKLLTEDEIPEGHSLFSKLLSKESIEGEDEGESPLGYLQEIRKIRDEQPTLFEKIKRLPKKARTARKSKENEERLLTYFRKGKIQKFFLVKADEIGIPQELDFLETAKILVAKEEEPRGKFEKPFYTLLEKNAEMLEKVTEQEEEDFSSRRGNRDNAIRLLKILKSKGIRHCMSLTDEDELYIEKVMRELEEGGIPKKISQRVYEKIEENPEIVLNPLKVLGVFKDLLPDDFLIPTNAEKKLGISSAREIILSEYFGL